MRAETREWLKRIDESGAPGRRPAAPESKAAEGDQLKTVVVSGLDAGRKGRSAKGARPAPSGAGQPARRHRRRAAPDPQRNHCGTCSPSGNSCWTNTIAPTRSSRRWPAPGPTREAGRHGQGRARAAPAASRGGLAIQLAAAVQHPDDGRHRGRTRRDEGGDRGGQERPQVVADPSSKRRTPRRPRPARSAAALRAERDKLFRSVAALKAKGQERETAVTSAKTAEERQLARERLTNAKLEAQGRGPPAQGPGGDAGPGGEPGRGPATERARPRGAGPGLAQVAGPDAASLPGPGRVAAARPQAGRGHRGEQGAAVRRPARAVPGASPGRAARARGQGRQERAGPGRPAAAPRWKRSAPWPIAPRATSPRSSSFSTTATSAGSTPSG